ncbi:hypothetical protein BLA13014_02635 [Burkholderia aenigmatica]|uniref:Uncharacterized protein n=1 Tax=Burkholderia aenigmatica TaxID=2015348 RepID=A0A6P2KTT3_9BURK|nr:MULTISPECIES: hypothetical protein [Burkholderia]VWB59306.1 hypothetical protein BLA13014_02635 [Burkholderia aenigmatica]
MCVNTIVLSKLGKHLTTAIHNVGASIAQNGKHAFLHDNGVMADLGVLLMTGRRR